MEPEVRYELIGYVDDEVVGKRTSYDINICLESAAAIEKAVDDKVDLLLSDLTSPVYYEEYHE